MLPLNSFSSPSFVAFVLLRNKIRPAESLFSIRTLPDRVLRSPTYYFVAFEAWGHACQVQVNAFRYRLIAFYHCEKSTEHTRFDRMRFLAAFAFARFESKVKTLNRFALLFTRIGPDRPVLGPRSGATSKWLMQLFDSAGYNHIDWLEKSFQISKINHSPFRLWSHLSANA